MAQHLPTYLLYAEDAGLPPSDVMHAESIAERSSLHSWEIRPHRHEALFQCFHVDSGTADILLDGELHALKGPGVITIMPLAVHGFRWTSDVRGTVFTMLESHIRRLLARDEGLRDALLQTRVARIPAARRMLSSIAETEPLPFVPATCTLGNMRSGWPRCSASTEMFSRSNLAARAWVTWTMRLPWRSFRQSMARSGSLLPRITLFAPTTYL